MKTQTSSSPENWKVMGAPLSPMVPPEGWRNTVSTVMPRWWLRLCSLLLSAATAFSSLPSATRNTSVAGSKGKKPPTELVPFTAGAS